MTQRVVHLAPPVDFYTKVNLPLKMRSIIYLFLRWCPGALGLLLRQKSYRYILGECGRNVLIGRFVNFKNPKKIYLNDNIIINDNVTLNASGFSEQGAAITLESQVFIGAGSSLQAREGKIILKSESSIGSFCILKTKSTIIIGKQVLLAAFCQIGYYPEVPLASLKEKTTTQLETETIIASGCWLGVRSIIYPGVCIAEGSIIGAHTVVQNSLPPGVIAVGVPAKVIRKRFE